MERREFLFSLASLPLIALPQLPFPEFKRLDWDLRFEKLPDNNLDSFVQKECYRISKGPYTCNYFNYANQDLLDSHGLCATIELADLIKQELEYGQEGLKKLYSLGWDCPQAERDYWLKKLKRVEISRIDRAKIVLFCNKLRGEHPCCLPHKRTIWRYAEKAILKVEPDWKLKIK